MPKHDVMVQLFIDGQAVWQVTEPVPADLVFKLTKNEMEAVSNGVKDLLVDVLAARHFVTTAPTVKPEEKVHRPTSAEIRWHEPKKHR